jgi:hypothetical protein
LSAALFCIIKVARHELIGEISQRVATLVVKYVQDTSWIQVQVGFGLLIALTNIRSSGSSILILEDKNKLPEVCYVPVTSDSLPRLFLASAINSSNEANKVVSTHH